MSDIRALADDFAKALDADDFETARRLLSAECDYEVRGQVLRGPDAIIACYARASASGRAALDEIRFESMVEGASGQAVTVRFVDHLRKGPRAYRFECLQHLTFSGRGLIVHITHEDIDGERERLYAFFESCGILL